MRCSPAPALPCCSWRSAMASAGQTPPKHTSTMGTAKTILPSQLKPGEYAWHPEFSPQGPDRADRVAAGATRLRIPERRDHRRIHGLDRKERTRNADGRLHDPAEARGSLLESLQQRAHALHAATHMGGRRTACGQAAGLPGVPRLRAHALRIRPAAVRRDEDRTHRHRFRREGIPQHGRASGTRRAGGHQGHVGGPVADHGRHRMATGGGAGRSRHDSHHQ